MLDPSILHKFMKRHKKKASRGTESAYFPIAPKSTGHSETVEASEVAKSGGEDSPPDLSTKQPPRSPPKAEVVIGERREIASGSVLDRRAAFASPVRTLRGAMAT